MLSVLTPRHSFSDVSVLYLLHITNIFNFKIGRSWSRTCTLSGEHVGVGECLELIVETAVQSHTSVDIL